MCRSTTAQPLLGLLQASHGASCRAELHPGAPWVRAGWLLGLSVLPRADPSRGESLGFVSIQEEPDFGLPLQTTAFLSLGHRWRGPDPSGLINHSNGISQFCWNLAQVGGSCTFLDGEALSIKESCQLGPELPGVHACSHSLHLAWVSISAALSQEGSGSPLSCPDPVIP